MKLQFFDQSSRDPDNWQASSARLVNCYLEPSGGETGSTIKAVLGTSAFCTLPGVFFRAMGEVGGYLYAACGGSLHKIDTSGGNTNLGAVEDGAEASIAGNNGNVTLCVGGKYYVWNGTTLAEPAPGAFSSFGSLTYIGNYTVLTEKDGSRFQWSAQANPASLPGLNFSSADGRDDKIIRCAAINGMLYIFKQKSHEIWYVTGLSNASAFERQAGGVVDVGLLSFGLLANIPGASVFFVGADGRAHIVGVGPVSFPPVETAIAQAGPDRCLCWEDEGHTMCAITFSNGPTWVYDLATGLWHERAEGSDLLPWSAADSAKMAGSWFVGRSGGAIVKLSRRNADVDGELVRLMVSRTAEGDGQDIEANEIQVYLRTGFEAGSVELRLSRNGGHTWGATRRRSWAVGEYGRMIKWEGLGSYPRLVAELRISDPAEVSVNAVGRIA